MSVNKQLICGGSIKMADLKETEKEIRETLQREKEELKNSYNNLVKRLQDEGKKLQGEMQKEYKSARKYVKKNPETGDGIALASGLIVGLAPADRAHV